MENNELQYFDSLRADGLRPQIVACFLSKKNVLFFFKQKHNLWQLPQGGINNHETVEKAFVREMIEELGKSFLHQCGIASISMTHEDQILFSEDKWNVKELSTDEGTPVQMQGKKYFFLAVEIEHPDIKIEETEFDDFRWLSYDEALDVSRKIYQKGKRRITIEALSSLRKNKLL